MNKKALVYIIGFAAFLGPFSQNVYIPVLPEVMESYQTTAFHVNLTISIYTFCIAIMQMVYGPLTDRIGRKNVMLYGIFIYLLASVGCYFSDSIYSLIILRAIQGIGIAGASVSALTIIGDVYKEEERAKAMGTYQVMITLGPVVGPVIGGLLAGLIDFHSVFLVLVVSGTIILLCNAVYVKETKPEQYVPKQFRLQEFGEVLKNKQGAVIIMMGFIQFYCYYNYLVFSPNIFTDVYALTSEQKGLALLPLTIAVVFGSFLGGRLLKKFDGYAILLNISALLVTSIAFYFIVAKLSLMMLLLALFMFGVCLGIALPIQSTILTGAYRHNRGTAVGVFSFFRYLGMAAGPLIGSVVMKLGGFIAVNVFMIIVCSLMTWLIVMQRKASEDREITEQG